MTGLYDLLALTVAAWQMAPGFWLAVMVVGAVLGGVAWWTEREV